MFRVLTSVMAIAVTGMAQTAWALSCMPLLLVEDGLVFHEVKKPGQPEYDPVEYGQHLYRILGNIIEAEDMTVLIGQATLAEGLPPTFLHEQVYAEIWARPRDPALGVLPSVMAFYYWDRFRFNGAMLVGSELVEQQDVDLHVTVQIEGERMSPLPEVETPIMLAVEVRPNGFVNYSP